jgi:nucleotide-binding universal stress UspA family protein
LGKKVLLATDDSEGAEPAARAAVEVAESTGSALHVVYVEPLPAFVKNGDVAPGYDHEFYEKIEEEARARLWKLTWRVKVGGGTVAEAHLRMGAVPDEIVDLADELGAGLIVVGSRGRGSSARRRHAAWNGCGKAPGRAQACRPIQKPVSSWHPRSARTVGL